MVRLLQSLGKSLGRAEERRPQMFHLA